MLAAIGGRLLSQAQTRTPRTKQTSLHPMNNTYAWDGTKWVTKTFKSLTNQPWPIKSVTDDFGQRPRAAWSHDKKYFKNGSDTRWECSKSKMPG